MRDVAIVELTDALIAVDEAARPSDGCRQPDDRASRRARSGRRIRLSRALDRAGRSDCRRRILNQ